MFNKTAFDNYNEHTINIRERQFTESTMFSRTWSNQSKIPINSIVIGFLIWLLT